MNKYAAKAALRIVLIYLAAAGIGLVLLPFFNLKTIVWDVVHLHVLQDILFLFLTATLLFVLLYKLTAQLYRSNQLANTNEIRYRALFDNMHEGGAVYRSVDHGQDFVFIDMNRSGEQIEQVKRQDLIGRRITEVFPRIEESGLLKVMKRVHSTGKPEHCPIFFYQDKRLQGWRENYVFRLDSGEVVAVYNDITEKMQLQEELVQSRAELTLRNKIITQFLTTDDVTVYSLILQIIMETLHSQDGFLGYLDDQGNLICLAITRDYLERYKLQDQGTTFAPESWGGIWGEALRDGKSKVKNNAPVVPANQMELPNRLAIPILYQKEIIGILCVANKDDDYSDRDIALLEHICSYISPILHSRLQAQHNEKLHLKATFELAKSESSLKEAEKLAKIGHWTHNFVNDTVSWSDGVYQIFSLDAHQFKPTSQTSLLQTHPDDQKLVYQAYSKSVAEKTAYNITHRLLLADGTIKVVHEQCITTYNEHGEPIQSLGTIQDITERVETQESNRRLITAIDQTVDVIMITDAIGTIQYVNPAFEKLSGYSRQEAIGQTPALLQSGEMSPEFYKELWSTIGKGEVWSGRFINKNKNGNLYTEEETITPVKDNNGKIINFVAVKHDISRELELEQQLRQAVKMEAIGTLAGGIAHDFNNILGAILGYTTMAMENLPKDSPPYNDLKKVIHSSDRAADLVHQILLFSRQQEQSFLPVHIQQLIKETVKMLRASLPASIVLVEKIEQNCPAIMADPTQIHQILMNLCTNAKQAMVAMGGTLTIILSKQKFGDDIHTISANLEPGEYIKISVTDTGSGIEKCALSRIFDPFFTTKAISEGSGLGLAVVHGIVKSHQGAITVDSELQKGTTFTVFLPALATKAETDQPLNEETRPGGQEHILVVDDELDILTIRQRILSSMGYTVATFSNSLEALASFREDPFQYDLLVTDMTMPDMDGKKLAESILALRPDMPVILCTGYSELINEQEALEHGIRAFLQKPIKPITLAKAIRKILDESILGQSLSR